MLSNSVCPEKDDKVEGMQKKPELSIMPNEHK
jgi:hypothetical protein